MKYILTSIYVLGLVYTLFLKVETLWEGHKIGKNVPFVLTKQLFLLSSVKTSGIFFSNFCGLLIKLRHYEKATKSEKNVPLVLTKQLFLLSSVKTSGIFFFKFLWPSQKNWTLQYIYLVDLSYSLALAHFITSWLVWTVFSNQVYGGYLYLFCCLVLIQPETRDKRNVEKL